MVAILPAQLGLPGGPELLLILGIAVLLFGANKLPALARSSGQAMGEFRKGREEIEAELREGASAASKPETTADSDVVADPESGVTPGRADLADGSLETK
jgi:sec-independent protein translocase protein TatA